jgi:hypothetical protein
MWYGISYAACNSGTIVASAPGDSLNGKPVDDGTGSGSDVPNEGVIRGGLFAPTPLPVPLNGGGTEPVPVERLTGRFDRPVASDLDDIKSIPTRATRKMKEDDAKREAVGAPARAGSGFDRTEASNKPGKSTVANSDAPQRVTPPSRQPTKSKGVGETRDSRPKGGYGTTSRPSEPRYNGPDRTSRTVDKSSGSSGGSSSSPGSIQSAPTGDKKKPPQ